MNTMDANQFSDLLKRYCSGVCTEEEKRWVEAWYSERRNTIYNPLTEAEEMLVGERMYNELTAMLATETNKEVTPVWRKSRFWQAAAASILLTATIGIVIFSKMRMNPPTAQAQQPVAPPVLPGGNKALLTLADGSVIVLDSAANGALTQQGKTTVLKKQDGELVYREEAPVKQTSIAWNTISTPRGGQYQVVLPDGSKVWLNAASSLRFPASFTGKERVVQLTGEAYFEVASLSLPPSRGRGKSPFIVIINPLQAGRGTGRIEVLGTHFNVNAYSDEPVIATTLLEGKVKFSQSEQSVILAPGEQGRLAENGQIDIHPHADVEEVVAWKNGRFQFNNADVQTVMRQIARWYDVEIEYAGKVPAEKFEGEIPRNSNIAEVFKILELSNVHCKTEGKKIIVLP